jgi:hypothetical protein
MMMLATSTGDIALSVSGSLVAFVLVLAVAIARDRERIARLEERTRRLMNGERDKD